MARYLEIAAGAKRGLNWDAFRDVADPEKGVEKYDMRQLPMRGIQDNTYDGAYNEHFIEHLHKDEGIAFLKEMYRVLKPGGTLRTIWPPREFVDKLLGEWALTADEEFFCAAYHNFYVVKHGFCPPEYRDRSIREQCGRALLWQKGEHLYVWGKAALIETLADVGFKSIAQPAYQESRLTDFRGIDTKGKIRALHSAVLEAKKPWS